MDDIEKACRLRQMSIGELVKRISAAGLQKDFMDLPEIGELWTRTPEELKDYLTHVCYVLGEPWRLRCMPSGGRRDDPAFFDIWVKLRNRDFPELDPNYVPPKSPDDDGSDGTGAPPGP